MVIYLNSKKKEIKKERSKQTRSERTYDKFQCFTFRNQFNFRYAKNIGIHLTDGIVSLLKCCKMKAIAFQIDYKERTIGFSSVCFLFDVIGCIAQWH